MRPFGYVTDIIQMFDDHFFTVTKQKIYKQFALRFLLLKQCLVAIKENKVMHKVTTLPVIVFCFTLEKACSIRLANARGPSIRSIRSIQCFTFTQFGTITSIQFNAQN